VDGVWGGMLADVDAEPSGAADAASWLLYALVVPATVTAVHVVAVQCLGRGEQPTVGGALRGAAPALVPVVAVVTLYSIGTALMTLLLIVPGIWFGVRFYFGAHAAIVDGEGPGEALSRSGALTDGCWWRTFWCLAVFAVLSFLIVGLVAFLAGLAAGAADSGVILVSGLVIGQALAYSYTALAGTLLFFDLRARKAMPAQVATV
jgi:hypothetical protein